MKRLPYTDAFVDESVRGQRYRMACVLVHARHLAGVRQSTGALAGQSKRLHFHQELASTRRTVLDQFAAMPVRANVVVCARSHGVSEFHARDACLAEIVRQLQAQSVSRLTIESRQDDRDDRRTIARSREAEPSLVFDHREGAREPLLWIADAVAWAFGAGGRWLTLVGPLIDVVTELRP